MAHSRKVRPFTLSSWGAVTVTANSDVDKGGTKTVVGKGPGHVEGETDDQAGDGPPAPVVEVSAEDPVRPQRRVPHEPGEVRGGKGPRHGADPPSVHEGLGVAGQPVDAEEGRRSPRPAPAGRLVLVEVQAEEQEGAEDDRPRDEHVSGRHSSGHSVSSPDPRWMRSGCGYIRPRTR